MSSSASTSVALKQRPDAVKPWHFHRHLQRLFSGRSTSSGVGSDRWNALDGWRAILCLWMVAFHSFFYAGNFAHDDEMFTVGMHPGLLLLNLGFLPVGGFFVLTGFLIAYPLFREERAVARRIRMQEKEKEGESVSATGTSSASSSSPWQFDLSRFYYRRVTRMLPSYLLAIYFHCGILFPGGKQHSMDVVRSEGFRGFMKRVLGDIDYLPNHCEPAMLFTNVFWTNHLMPFGGCMGWTWSFALQFNFYLFFPLLWKWLHKRANRAFVKEQQQGESSDGSSSSRPLVTPSSFLFPFLYGFILLSLLVRSFSFLQVRRFDLRHEEGVFLGFFWYSNTITRGAAIVWGVLAARASLDALSATHEVDGDDNGKKHSKSGIVARLSASRPLRWTCWFLTLSTVLLQMFWSRLFADGNMVETPGWSSMKETQRLGGPDSLTYTTPNVMSYLHHAFFQIFILVGGPLSNLSFAFLLLVVLQGIGRIGRGLQRVLSLRIFFTISTLSWWVYLVHPALMIWWNAWRVSQGHEVDMSFPGVWRGALTHWLLSFSVATVAYVFVEMPLEIVLRKGEESVAAAEREGKRRKEIASQSSDSNGDAIQPASSTSSAPSTSSSSFQRTFFTHLRRLIFIYCICCVIYIVLHHLAMYLAVLSLQPKPYIEGQPIGGFEIAQTGANQTATKVS